MLELMILVFMMLYFVIAYVIVRSVWRSTSDRRLRTLSVAIAVLLPSWDAVLSAIFFYTACPFIPKAEIYETAKTEGIYYEGRFRNIVYIGSSWDGREVNGIGAHADEDIEKGYQYVEALITRQKNYHDNVISLPNPTVYRCIEYQKNPTSPRKTHSQCYPVEDVKSKYVVKTVIYGFALIEVGFVKIYERSTGLLMAEYRQITKYQYAGIIIPFFTWLDWGSFKLNVSDRCPEKSQLFTFQYEVLKNR